MTRRDLLFAPALTAAPGAGKVLLGGPVFLKSDDPRELAREYRRLGYSAAYCPPVKVTDEARLRAIEAAFHAEKVVIAEVGVWVNMLDPDATKRRANLERVIEGMAIADRVGARCCVDIAGSYNPTVWYGPHPKNLSREFFDATVENCRAILDRVKPTRSKFTLEMMGWNLPDGPDSYLDLIRAINRPGFAVHLDVCNGIQSPARFYNNAAFIRECFAKLGRWIVSAHAKDLTWVREMNVHFLEVAPGRGEVDYRAYLTALSQLPAPVPLMLEHLKTPEEYAGAAQFVRHTAAELGIGLSS